MLDSAAMSVISADSDTDPMMRSDPMIGALERCLPVLLHVICLFVLGGAAAIRYSAVSGVYLLLLFYGMHILRVDMRLRVRAWAIITLTLSALVSLAHCIVLPLYHTTASRSSLPHHLLEALGFAQPLLCGESWGCYVLLVLPDVVVAARAAVD